MAYKLRRALSAGQIPESYCTVVGSRHEGGKFCGREPRRPHGLFVLFPGLEDGARVDIEDLDLAAVVTGNHNAAITADLTTVSNVRKASYGLDEFAGSYRVDLDARAGRDGEVVIVRGEQRIAGRRRERNVSDRI